MVLRRPTLSCRQPLFGASLPPHQNPTASPNLKKPDPRRVLFLSQFCGHAMHYSCFDQYYATVVQMSESHNDVALDVKRGEFHCPLCKAVGNLMVRGGICFELDAEHPNTGACYLMLFPSHMCSCHMEQGRRRHSRP